MTPEELRDLLACVQQHRGVVLTAPTGSGKTTQVPPALLDAGWLDGQKVLLLEPRRIAARAASRYMARARGSAVGKEIGYAVRFDVRRSEHTRLLVMTEGLLTRRLLDDATLEGVGAVILDEFHERNLETDLALGMLKEVRDTVREDLILIVMSATLDAESVARFLDVPTFRVEGRSFPVEIRYDEGEHARRLEHRVSQGVAQLLASTEGDLLVFLPGAGEIRRCGRALENLADEHDLEVLPLHGDLKSEQQDRVLTGGPRRRVILATNVAETSLTIDGITGVVDSGLHREARFDPKLRTNRLELKTISKANADQRTGRAGRTAPGVCLRLWPRARERELSAAQQPSVIRVDLSRALLELHAWSRDPASFSWLTSPPVAHMEAAGAELRSVGAVRNDRLTDVGRALLNLSAPLRSGRLLMSGHRWDVLDQAAVCAALMDEKDIVSRNRSMLVGGRRAMPVEDEPSDLVHRMELLESDGTQKDLDRGAVHRVKRTARHLLRQVKLRVCAGFEQASDAVRLTEEQRLMCALMEAFPDRLVRRREEGSPRGVMVGERGVRLADTSVVRTAPFFLALTLMHPGKGQGTESMVGIAHGVDLERILAQDDQVRIRDELVYDSKADRVRCRRVTNYRDLAIAIKEGLEASAQTIEELLAEELAKDPKAWIPDDPTLEVFRARCAFLAREAPELHISEWTEDRLAEVLGSMLGGCRSKRDLWARPLVSVLTSMMGRAQLAALEQHAPERLALPSGRSAKVHYPEGDRPILSARVQDLFGVLDTPRLALDRVTCLVELLAPNHRPVQRTTDLRSFWTNTYSQVRKDLRRRYSKHAWPERPPGFEN